MASSDCENNVLLRLVDGRFGEVVNLVLDELFECVGGNVSELGDAGIKFSLGSKALLECTCVDLQKGFIVLGIISWF